MIHYLLDVGTYVALMAIVGLSLNLMWGMAGMINLGMIGFFASGAYIAALLTTKLHAGFLQGVLASGIAVALMAGFIGYITWRLRGDYLAVVTLGFSEFIRLIASNEIWLTNGTDGISNITAPFRSSLSPVAFSVAAFSVAGACLLVALLAFQRLCYSPFGRALRAIRDDEEVAWTAGKNSRAMKAKAFAIGGFCSAVAGALYAHFNSYIAPDSFLPLLSLYIVFAVTIGGRGNMLGAIVGTVLIVAFTEGTRFLVNYLTFLQPVQGAALREMTVALSFLLILIYLPRGIFPERMLSWRFAGKPMQ
ncbi:MAG TPA: branched-chain amino acid ABC transporter permease [Candidatus Baltobacteraceae bacterium]|jgi:branched-chain amino acid transport system permease protein